jgi:poly-gamma-glutamate capsule biosynthesis protein CapA/YwtB (metallophosphatase superfamily)
MKKSVRIFLCGDVMTGRGIDQILPHPSAPHIYEPCVLDARGYLRLAERASGPIPFPADFSYPWGDALSVLDRMAPALRIINLETSVTTSEHYWEGKGINYRMHPGNIPCLSKAGVDACALANNHVLDWGYDGLAETLSTLHAAGIKGAGAGNDLQEAETPARLDTGNGALVQLFSYGFQSSGIPASWGATAEKSGVNLLPDLSPSTVQRVAEQTGAAKGAGDVVIVSLHWGENWGYDIGRSERIFAQQLIDKAGADIIFGHSSHHVKGIELYHGKLVLYGCGDFINDYEGIRGYEQFRGDLGLMYFPEVSLESGELLRLEMVPTRIRKFRVELASQPEAEWLLETLNREGRGLGTGVRMTGEGHLVLQEL